jgi:hypothetical protein
MTGRSRIAAMILSSPPPQFGTVLHVDQSPSRAPIWGCLLQEVYLLVATTWSPTASAWLCGMAGSCLSPPLADGRDSVMAAVDYVAIRRDRQVQDDVITGPRTRPRPIAAERQRRFIALQPTFAGSARSAPNSASSHELVLARPTLDANEPAHRSRLCQRSRSVTNSRLTLVANFAISAKACWHSGSRAIAACAFS